MRPRPMLIALLALLGFGGAISSTAVAQTAQPMENAPQIQVRGYVLDVILDPAHHSLAVRAQVNFRTFRSLQTVAFALNPALRVSGVADGAGNGLKATQDHGEIRVTPASALLAGSTASWTFTYGGVLDASAGLGEPAMGARSIPLVSIGEPVSYLLYGAHWFPMVGYETNRFTATMHVHVPAGEHVFGSGMTGTPHVDGNRRMVFDFDWAHAGFPGTLVAGKFQGPYGNRADSRVRVYLIDGTMDSKTKQPNGQEIAKTAQRAYDQFTADFGAAETGQLNVVELPDGTLPAVWAPELAAIASEQLRSNDWSRLLVNTIARQWWGNQVSPATLDDAWITNGMCRYAELGYLQQSAKPRVMADAIFNVSASALAYSNVPLTNVEHYPVYSPAFEAMTYDKGAMIFRMLRWEIGDAAFQQTLRSMLSETDKSISSATLETMAEAEAHRNLRAFFTQWLNDTGAPTLKDTWTLYRLGNNQGFRIAGEIDEDLDLFQMPVEMRVETEGKTVTKRILVMGPQTQFTIDTFGMPRKVSLDPDRWLLRNGDAIQVRVHILLGLAKMAQNDDAGAIEEYRAALALNPLSSLANYRLGEVYFLQHNYQAAEAAFRGALSGDGVPQWTEVWSDVQLGKIFDASGQRERAVNQYREAIATGDDTSGALEVAGDYMQQAYTAPKDGGR